MNVKKTIASIAAIAMVASATSLAPLFTGTNVAADETNPVVDSSEGGETNTDTDENGENNNEPTESTETPSENTPAPIDDTGDAEGETEEETGITTLEALKTAISGSEATITLGADITTAEAITISRNVTLNLNGHTITASAKIPSTGSAYTVSVIHVTSGNVTISGGTVNGGDKDHYVVSVDTGATVAINNATIVNDPGANYAGQTVTAHSIIANYGTLTLNGAQVESKNGAAAVKVEEGATLNVTGGSRITATDLGVTNWGTTTVGGGSTVSSCNKAFNSFSWNGDATAYPSVITVNDATINGGVCVGTSGSTQTTMPVINLSEDAVVTNFDVVQHSAPAYGTGDPGKNTDVNIDPEAKVTLKTGVDLTDEDSALVKGLGTDVKAVTVTKNGVETTYLGGAADEAIEGLANGDKIELVKNVDEIEVPTGVEVENNTGVDVSVNGETVADGETTTVTPTVTPPPVEDEPTDAEKLAEVNAAIDVITANNGTNWNFHTWVSISELEGGYANSAVAVIQNSLRDEVDGFGLTEAEVTLVSYTTANGSDLVTFTIKVKVGTAEATRDIVLKCKDDRVVDVVTPTPTPVVSYYPPVVFNNPVNPSAGTVQTVSTVAQMSAFKQKEVTVNAAETDVTPSMVKAFVKNKNIKTLTLKYSSSLKISIDKSSISDASAKLDFSVSGKKFLSSKLLKKLNAEKVVQLDFVNAGKLEGVDKVTVKSRVGANYIGKTVTIYEYKNGKLVKVGKATVNGAGIVKFNTNRLGQFVLAVE